MPVFRFIPIVLLAQCTALRNLRFRSCLYTWWLMNLALVIRAGGDFRLLEA